MNDFVYNVEITSEDLTPPYNHLHHAQIMYRLETARVKYLEHIGHPIEELHNSGLLPVLREMKVEYLREITAGKYQITCENARIDKRTMYLEQIVTNERNKVCVKAEMSLMMLSRERGRAVKPSEEFSLAFTS